MVKYNKISNDDREKICHKVVEEGKSQVEMADFFHLNLSTVNNIVKRYRQTTLSTLSAPAKKGGVVINDQIKGQLMGLINDDCTISISRMIEKLNLNVTETTVWRWLKSMNITFKMTRSVPLSRNLERTKIQRKEYVEWYGSLPIQVRYDKLIFVDESPFNIHIICFGLMAVFFMRGVTPNSTIPNSRGPNVTMILATSALLKVLYTVKQVFKV